MVYTQEEAQAIRQLEDMGCSTLFETNIKEVVGGFIIAHQTSYVLDGEVKAVTREQIVASDHYVVSATIAGLYGSVEKDEPTAIFPDFDPSKHVHDLPEQDGDTFLDRVQAAVNQPPKQVFTGKLPEAYYPASDVPPSPVADHYEKMKATEQPNKFNSHVNQPGG